MVIVKYPNQMCLSKIIEGKAKKKNVLSLVFGIHRL